MVGSCLRLVCMWRCDLMRDKNQHVYSFIWSYPTCHLVVFIYWVTSAALHIHHRDVIMSKMTSQFTSLMIVYSIFLFMRSSKKTSKLRVTDLCEGNSPSQRASNAENVSIWWRHHDMTWCRYCLYLVSWDTRHHHIVGEANAVCVLPI